MGSSSAAKDKPAAPSGGGLSFNFLPNANSSVAASKTDSPAKQFDFKIPAAPQTPGKAGDSNSTSFKFNFNFPNSSTTAASTSATTSTATSTAASTLTVASALPGKADSGASKFNFAFPSNLGSSEIKPFSFGTTAPKLTFNFGTGVDFQAEKREFSASNFIPSFSPSFPTPPKAEAEPENEPDEEKAGFVEAEKTGEEDEDRLLATKAKLFILKDVDNNKKEYVERGIGEIHFNYNKEGKFYRLIMRRQNVGTVMLNQRIFPAMNPKTINKVSIRFLGKTEQKAEGEEKKKDEEKNEDDKSDESKLDVLLLKVKEEDVQKLLELMNKAIKECE